MKKKFFGDLNDFEFNRIEIDIAKGIYKIDGIPFGRHTEELTITIGMDYVWIETKEYRLGRSKKPVEISLEERERINKLLED